MNAIEKIASLVDRRRLPLSLRFISTPHLRVHPRVFEEVIAGESAVIDTYQPMIIVRGFTRVQKRWCTEEIVRLDEWADGLDGQYTRLPDGRMSDSAYTGRSVLVRISDHRSSPKEHCSTQLTVERVGSVIETPDWRRTSSTGADVAHSPARKLRGSVLRTMELYS